VVVTGWSDGRITWPLCRASGLAVLSVSRSKMNWPVQSVMNRRTPSDIGGARVALPCSTGVAPWALDAWTQKAADDLSWTASVSKGCAMYPALLIVVAVMAQHDNEAERLFRHMEERLSKAKSLECVFEVKAAVGQGSDFRGRLLVAEGNKLRMETEGKWRGAITKMVVISDGAKLAAETGGTRKDLSKKVPKSLHQEVVRVLTYVGVRMLGRGVIVPEAPEGQETQGKRFANRLTATGLKLGKKERLNGRDAQVIEYETKLEGEDDVPTATLWLDTKTKLPLKRTLTDKQGGKLIYTETYLKLAVGGKIDEKEFKLPK